MKILYLDCQTGVSGDMLLSAMLGTGIAINELTDELQKLPIKSYELSLREKKVKGISTLNIEVNQTKDEPLRHLSDLKKIIDDSGLSKKVQEKCMKVFRTLAEAEAKVHGTSIEKVHFHEVGAVDTIIDVVGVISLIELIKPDKVISSAVNLGSGFVEFSHGKHPVPVPAVAEIAKGMKVFSTDSQMEMATPTGMAILKNVVDGFGDIPEGTIEAVGYGSGKYSDEKNPTYLRAIVMQ